ncbi:hypothetical protein U1E44_08315 [Arenibacter sp. GZD96]|uniref:hypothetical protein n=1 Tax=Aurantibrevibacter litoralis TaxID=3106030 RepID=UPI002B0002D7|nr:hypothetical protein [Arenibacter sp. GZD-96]MEA1786091.1 hypothetical protein [Arenibacter sp. GZD-96]
MLKKKCIFILFAITFGCGPEQDMFKEGKFKFYPEEGLQMIIERNNKYQLEYSMDGRRSELFKIYWQGDSIYQLESIRKKDSTDFNNLFVKIDSIINDTLYLTSYMKGIDFTVSSKMIRIDNNLSDKLKWALKRETLP